MPTIADLRAKIEIQGAQQAKKDLQELKGSGGSSGGGIMGLADSFKSGLGAVTGFLTGFAGFQLAGDAVGLLKAQFGDMLQAGMDQQKVMAQTDTVIRSMGLGSKISAGEVGDLADALAKQTGISDDTVQSVENLLLTFGNLSAKQLPQTTSLVLDLATAMHEDTQSAAIQLGKALNDPIQGVTALRRVGVQLSQQQMDAVKHFMAVGNVAAAQKIIMGELTREVGGSAEAYGTTMPGQMARLNVSFDQMKEKIALAVLPILQDMVTKYVMPLADWLGAHLPAALQAVTTFLNTKFVPAVDAIINSPFVKTVEGWAQSLGVTLTKSAGAGTKALDERGLAGGADKAKGSMKSLSSQASTTGKDIDPTFNNHINKGVTQILGLADAIDPDTGTKGRALVPAMRRADAELDTLTGKEKANQDAIPAWQGAIGGMAGTWDGFTSHIHQAMGALGQFRDSVSGSLGAALNTLHWFSVGFSGNLTGFGINIKSIWEGAFGALAAPVQIAFHIVEAMVTSGLDSIAAITTGKWGKVTQDWVREEKQIEGDVQQFVNSVQRILSGLNLPDWLKGIGGVNLNGGQHRASGGPVSGAFIGAEQGPELLLTPGRYSAPAGSYVVNAPQTRAILSQAASGGAGVTHVYHINVSGPNEASLARKIAHQVDWRASLHS